MADRIWLGSVVALIAYFVCSCAAKTFFVQAGDPIEEDEARQQAVECIGRLTTSPAALKLLNPAMADATVSIGPADVLAVLGHAESGFNGDGHFAWYRVDLRPAQVDRLRAHLLASSVEPADGIKDADEPGDEPAWWPTEWGTGGWPEECRTFGNEYTYLIIPPVGGRLWIKVDAP